MAPSAASAQQRSRPLSGPPGRRPWPGQQRLAQPCHSLPGCHTQPLSTQGPRHEGLLRFILECAKFQLLYLGLLIHVEFIFLCGEK